MLIFSPKRQTKRFYYLIVCFLFLFSFSGLAYAGSAMVVTADPRATDAAGEILRRGGSAVDAAIAAQMVLGLVEPQSSGIGGGAFLLHYEGKSGDMVAYDGRERAPMGVDENLFLHPDGTPMGFMEAVIGGRSVGVPGVLAMLWQAHKAHGRLSWEELFKPAIRLSESGFAISPRLHMLLQSYHSLKNEQATREYFFRVDSTTPDGLSAKPVGHILVNPAYAHSLRLIATKGISAFYEGPLAQAMVNAVEQHRNRGYMSLSDLSSYMRDGARPRSILCRPYKAYRLCTMPPPTSGGITSLMILGILSHYDIGSLTPSSLEFVHLFSSASKLAYADRDMYMADSDFVDVPVAGLLSPSYLSDRASLIGERDSGAPVKAGIPFGTDDHSLSPDVGITRPGTSHISVIDSDGNGVSMTTTIEGGFGSHIMVGGFLLNNELTDFSFRPRDEDGRLIANRVEGNKRPRSSMSPFLILDDRDRLLGVLGSPGGSRIIEYVSKTLIALLDWDLGVQEAVDLPHFMNRNRETEIEVETPLTDLIADLESLGHRVVVRKHVSGLNAILRRDGGLQGGTDKRREGTVLFLP